MPQSKFTSPQDRSLAVNTNTWPRINGDLILLPDDILEGTGNLSDLNQDGQPDGMKIVAVEQAEFRHIYVGRTADSTTRQNPSGVAIAHSSYLLNHVLIDGDPPPSPGMMIARIATPGKPTIKIEAASTAGFPEGTPQKPHWLAFGFSQGERRSAPGPPVSFTGGQGQSYRVTLPQDPPVEATGIDIYMADPVTSTASTPGALHRQVTLDLFTYSAPTYDLTGPFRYEQAPGDQYGAKAKAPKLLHLANVREAALPGTWSCVVTYTTRTTEEAFDWWRKHWNPLEGSLGSAAMAGETEASASSDSVVIDVDTSWPNLYAGTGPLQIIRPPLPPEAKGWMVYVNHIAFIPGGVGTSLSTWGNIVDGRHGADALIPWPLSVSTLTFNGFGAGAPFSRVPYFAIGSQPPTLTAPVIGLTPPDSKPEVPLAIGDARPGPGTYFARATEEVGGLETLPSAPAEANIGENDVMRFEFFNVKNQLPNATLKEKDSSGLPLSYTVTQTNGAAKVEAGELVLSTNGVQTGTTPDVLTAKVPVQPTEEWSVSFPLEMANPTTGALAGQVEAVLRQVNAAGATTDTVLATLSAVGETSVKTKILPTGSAGTYVWASDTTNAQLLYRFSGASKNATMRISQQVLKGYGWFFRRRTRTIINGVASTTNVSPDTAIGPGADVAVEPPPRTLVPPQGQTVESPDRPSSAGTVYETSGYESGIPGGWAQTTTGGGAISTTAGAALAGSVGLRLLKSAGGALSSAYISKTLPPDSGLTKRHDSGLGMSYAVPSITDGAYIDLHGLSGTGGRFARLRYGKSVEQAKLTIEHVPRFTGSVIVNLNGTATTVPVTAAYETANLTISATPTTPGTVKVKLDDTPFIIPAGDQREKFTIRIDGKASSAALARLNIDGKQRLIDIQPRYSAAEIASQIAGQFYAGWTTSFSGTSVTFLADLPGPRTDVTFDVRTSGLPYTLTIETQGVTETTASLAARIRDYSYPGWVASGTASNVIFTAIEAGAKANASYDPGTTGATGTMTTTVEGSAQTTSSLAAAIRATVFTGWTTGGTANEVMFTATTSGARQNAFYDENGTGATGTMETLVEGSSGDVSAIVVDKDGVEHQQKILLGVGTSTFNVDVGVSGADARGPDDEPSFAGEAVLNFFGSTGTNPLTLVARFEGIDLTGFPAGILEPGVVGESSAAATWEVYGDTLKTTNRGETHFNDHDYYGALLNQLYYHGPPTQPTRDDILIQDKRIPVLPGEQVSLSAKIRYDGIPAAVPAFPLYLSALVEGQELGAGDIAGGEDGISGTAAWHESSPLTFEVPENCYELKLQSKQIGFGEIVIQEIAGSVGATVKRTPLYATSGTHLATLDISTPSKWRDVWDVLSSGRQRKILDTFFDVPAGTSASVTYRGGDKQENGSIVWDSVWQTDPTLVSQKEALQISATMVGDGLNTPILKSGTPVADYQINGASGTAALAMFLKHDATELPGGAVFQTYQEWEDLSEIIIHPKPGGDFDRSALYDSVKTLPEFSVYVFTPEARRYIAKKWGLEYFVIEAEGTALTIKMPSFGGFERADKRQTVNGQVHAVYVATIPAGAVVTEERALR